MTKHPKYTPNVMRNLYEKNGGYGKYETWTQVEKLTEWPPGERSVMFFYRGYILVGASADNRAELDVWRRKHSVWSLPKTVWSKPREASNYRSPITIGHQKDAAWLEMHRQGMKQSDIARALEVSPAYVSIIKRRMREQGAI